MANSSTLGQLVVELLLKDDTFQAGLVKAQGTLTALSTTSRSVTDVMTGIRASATANALSMAQDLAKAEAAAAEAQRVGLAALARGTGFGSLAEKAGNLGVAIEALGPAGVAAAAGVGATAVGVVALVAGMAAIAGVIGFVLEANDKLGDLSRLAKEGIAPIMTVDQIESIHGASAAWERLGDDFEAAGLTVAAQLAPAVETLLDDLVALTEGAASAGRKLVDAATEAEASWVQYGDALKNIGAVALGLAFPFAALALAAADLSGAFDQARIESTKWAETLPVWDAVGAAIKEFAAAQKKAAAEAAAAWKAAAAAAKQMAKDYLSAMGKMEDIQQGGMTLAGSQEANDAAYEKQIKAANDFYEQAITDAAKDNEKIEAAEALHLDTLTRLHEEWEADSRAIAQKAADAEYAAAVTEQEKQDAADKALFATKLAAYQKSLVDKQQAIIDAQKAWAAAVKQTLADVGTAVSTLLGAFSALTGGFSLSVSGVLDMVSSSADAVQAAKDARAENIASGGKADPTKTKQTVAQVSTAAVTAMVDQAKAFIRALIQGLPAIIQSLAKQVPELIEVLAKNMDTIVGAIADNLPILITAIVGAIPDLAATTIEALVTKLWPQLPKIALELIVSIFKAFAEFVSKIATMIWDAIIGKNSDDATTKTPPGPSAGRAATGLDYAAATMRVTMHPGEGILDADENAARLAARAARSSSDAGGYRSGMGGVGPSTPSFSLAMMADGRVLDQVMATSDARGKGVRFARQVRGVAGSRVGFDGGRVLTR